LRSPLRKAKGPHNKDCRSQLKNKLAFLFRLQLYWYCNPPGHSLISQRSQQRKKWHPVLQDPQSHSLDVVFI